MLSINRFSKKRVLVIGGGASGMIAVKEFSGSQAFHTVCMEQLPVVGGLWNYSEVITQPDHPTGSKYTAVYKNLKSNVPKQLMAYSDGPFRDDLPSYIGHTDMKEYLWSYAETHKLHQYIKFNTRVTSVKPQTQIGVEDVWEVESINVLTKEIEKSEFDIVIVCPGIQVKCKIPVVKGMKEFEGIMIHSQDYRDPEDFRGKSVMLVGASYSGTDLAIEIHKAAKKVWIINKEPGRKNLPDSIYQCKGIMELTKNGVIVQKKEEIDEEQKNEILNSNNNQNNDNKNEVHKADVKKESGENGKDITNIDDGMLMKIDQLDVLIFCTGYSYSFPYLNADCGVSVISRGNVGPLYKDTILLGRQSLSFIGVNQYGTVPLFEYQAKFLKAFYEGKFKIPPYGKDLLEIVEKDIEKKRSKDIDVDLWPLRIPYYQFEFLNELAEIGGFEKLHDRYEVLFNAVDAQRTFSHLNYRNFEYELGPNGYFVEKIKIEG